MSRLWTSRRMLDHETGEGHVERPDRLTWVLDRLEREPWSSGLDRREPDPAPKERILRVHDEAMVERTRATCAEGGGWLDADTVVSTASWDAARRAAGASVEAAGTVARDGGTAYALVRPPGHHATPSRAMGFCLVNNVAVAARALLDDGAVDRVAVLDHDVHHGNGTQDVFWASADVLYVSLHQSPLYPGTGAPGEVGTGEGEGFTVNLPVPAGFGEGGVLALLDEVVVPVAEAYDPDLWLVSAGLDGHRRDPLGGLDLGDATFPKILARIADVEERMVVCLEGGYDREAVAESATAQIGWLQGRVDAGPGTPDRDAAAPVVEEVRGAIGPWWDV